MKTFRCTTTAPNLPLFFKKLVFSKKEKINLPQTNMQQRASIHCLVFFACLLITYTVFAQATIKDSILSNLDNLRQFTPFNLPPSEPAHPGQFRRQPTTTYFWNFGDGGFSQSLDPVHRFAKVGTYTVTLEATKIYSDTEPEESEVALIDTVITITNARSRRPNRGAESLGGPAMRVIANRAPRSDDPITYVVTYENTTSNTVDGTVDFVYDPTQFTLDNVEMYANENFVDIGGVLQWDFSGLAPAEQRNIFIKMMTSAALQEGDSAIVQAMIVAPNITEIQTLSKVTVKSHDPNQIHSYPNTICAPGPETICYTIEFQNYGSGPADFIQVRDRLSVLFEVSSFVEVEVSHPAALMSVIAPDEAERLAVWNFDGINLPGLHQKGIGTLFQEADTKGYVKFCIDTKPLMGCEQIPNQGEIVFDCNAPIWTNIDMVKVDKVGCVPCDAPCSFNPIFPDAVQIKRFEPLPLSFVAECDPYGGGFFNLSPECQMGGSNQIFYFWYPHLGVFDGEFFQENPFTACPFLQPDTTTTYVLTMMNPVECWSITDTLVVFVDACDDDAPPLTIGHFNPNSIACEGELQPDIMLDAAGGVSSYTYYGIQGCFEFDGDTSLMDLQPGIYPYAVSDINRCLAFDSIVIPEPLDLWVDVEHTETCCTCIDATMGLIPSGGTPPYSYQWGDGTTDSILTNQGLGGYDYTVTDAMGCVFGGVAQVQASHEVLLQIALEGALIAGTCYMQNTLKNEVLLPLQQPYDGVPWNYGGIEGVATLNELPPNTVDWVLVELRDAADSTIIVEQKAGLLLDNGQITDLDGATDGIAFCNAVAGEAYFVLVRHRNHLDIITATAVTLPNNTIYNFTLSDTMAMGEGQLKEVKTGFFALYGGNYGANGTITVNDFNVFTSQSAILNDYAVSDGNLDGNVTVADFNVYQPNASKIGVGVVRY